MYGIIFCANIFEIKFFVKWSNFLRELVYLQYKMDEYDFDTQLEKYSKYLAVHLSVCLIVHVFPSIRYFYI